MVASDFVKPLWKALREERLFQLPPHVECLNANLLHFIKDQVFQGVFFKNPKGVSGNLKHDRIHGVR